MTIHMSPGMGAVQVKSIMYLLTPCNAEVHTLVVLEIPACTDHRAVVADVPVAPKPVAVFRSSRKNWYLPEKLKVPFDSSARFFFCLQ